MDAQFAAVLEKSRDAGGWVYVVWPKSVEYFGTRDRSYRPTGRLQRAASDALEPQEAC